MDFARILLNQPVIDTQIMPSVTIVPEGANKHRVVISFGVIAERVIADATADDKATKREVKLGPELFLQGNGSMTVTADPANKTESTLNIGLTLLVSGKVPGTGSDLFKSVSFKEIASKW
jgi:hypothetical protein